MKNRFSPLVRSLAPQFSAQDTGHCAPVPSRKHREAPLPLAHPSPDGRRWGQETQGTREQGPL
ncbi:conserved hypothetical protein [Streptomyces sp. SPB78]|nr:conserved hypothetical protein [Streptomyces sp. SPB78]